MGAFFKSGLLRIVIFVLLSTAGILYLLRLHPQSIPEWMTIPILLIALGLLLWRKSLRMVRKELLDALIGCLFFGNGFAICWLRNRMGLLTSLLGGLFVVCLLIAIRQLLGSRVPRP